MQAKGRPRKATLRTFSGDLLARLLRKRAERVTLQWPSPKYRQDIIGFAENILGIRPWKRQRDVLLAIQNNQKIAVRSGRRVSKSNSVAIGCLWHYCSFEGSKVAVTAPAGDTVQNVVYDELCKLQDRSGICLNCREAGVIEKPCPHSAIITGEQSKEFRYGIRAGDRRRIFGYAVKKPGASRGIAAPNLMLVCDEASEVDDEVLEVLQGNAASSKTTKILYTGNPSRVYGAFYGCFHGRSHLWTTIHISSFESPNITGEAEIPGLADEPWIRDQAETYGVESPQYKVDVLGEFASLTESRPFSMEKIEDAMQRHKLQEGRGILHLGCDPAGPTGTEGYGDESALALRRGFKILELLTDRGLDEDELTAWVVALLEQHRRGDEVPVVILDADGPIGKHVRLSMEAYLLSHPSAFRLTCVFGANDAIRDQRVWGNRRDETWGNFSRWLDKGGTLPTDKKLTEELAVFQWTKSESTNKAKALKKEKFRQKLSRSPDRADACVLSCWQERDTAYDSEQTPKAVAGFDRVIAPWDKPKQPNQVPSQDWRGERTGADRDWRG